MAQFLAKGRAELRKWPQRCHEHIKDMPRDEPDRRSGRDCYQSQRGGYQFGNEIITSDEEEEEETRSTRSVG